MGIEFFDRIMKNYSVIFLIQDSFSVLFKKKVPSEILGIIGISLNCQVEERPFCCFVAQNLQKYIQPQDKKTETNPIPQTDAITKMTTVFQGGSSKSHIKSKLDQMMTLYNLPITEEYYNRVGSVLVGLENEYGVPEMDILQCVIDAHTPGVKIEFTSTAALCTIMIKNE